MNSKRIRYGFSLLAIVLMAGISEYTGEREILFPEMAALTIGLWIVDKRVWQVRRRQVVALMTLGAAAGVCIVRYCAMPQPLNLAAAFAFAALCLVLSRTTLIPLISACMLPVLLHTESWIYPGAVLIMSLILVAGQKGLEQAGLREKIPRTPPGSIQRRELVRWLALLGCVLCAAWLAEETGAAYLIIPPLVVTFAELVHSKAGFRNRPLQTFLFLTAAVTLGTLSQTIGHHYLHLPEWSVALFVIVCLLVLFELTGKYFAPAGALALIPMLVPAEDLPWLPLQAAAGGALFITIAMLVFQRCYTWNRAQLLYSLTPAFTRRYLSRGNRGKNRPE